MPIPRSLSTQCVGRISRDKGHQAQDKEVVLWDTWCHAHSHPRAGSLCSSVETPSDSKDSWGREVRAWSRVQAPGGGGSVWKRRKLYRWAGRCPQPGSGRTCDLAGTGSGLLVWMDARFVWEVVVVGWRVRGAHGQLLQPREEQLLLALGILFPSPLAPNYLPQRRSPEGSSALGPHLPAPTLLAPPSRGEAGKRAHFSRALSTNVPGPFLWRPREEIKCQPDKEISFSSDAEESEVMIPPGPHKPQPWGQAHPGQARPGARLSGPARIRMANTNNSVKLQAGDKMGSREGLGRVPGPQETPGLSTGAFRIPSRPAWIFKAE